MLTRENTIGSIHWGGIRAGTTGAQIALVIPAFFQQHHVPFLEGILASRLNEVLGYGEIRIDFDPGWLDQNERGTHYEPGTIVVYGIREPWPDRDEFRTALDDAFVQAGEVEAEQAKKTKALVAHLRTD